METPETPKRKYKKHKEGFKIAVEYKLNTKLKSMHYFDGRELYPVYVEVRARRKRTFFPSVHSFYINPEEFEAFQNNSIVKSLIESEIKQITSIVANYDLVATPPTENNDLQMSWLQFYQHWNYQNNIDVILNNKILGKLKDTFVGNDAHFDNFLRALKKIKYFKETTDYLSSMVDIYNNPEIQESIIAIKAYSRLKEFLGLYSKQWLYPEVHGIFFLEQSMKMSILSDNNHIIDKIKSFGNQSDMYFHDLKVLKNYVTKSKNV